MFIGASHCGSSCLQTLSSFMFLSQLNTGRSSLIYSFQRSLICYLGSTDNVSRNSKCVQNWFGWVLIFGLTLHLLLYLTQKARCTWQRTELLFLCSRSLFFFCSAPDAIPKNLKGVGTWRNNMEISWEVTGTCVLCLHFFCDSVIYLPTWYLRFQPVSYREWNGPHLKYLVWWKRRDSREEWKNATTKWLKYYIYDADTFTPYDLKIQAVNDFGLGPESPVVIGYSGEDRTYKTRHRIKVCF